MIQIVCDDVLKWAESYNGPPFHAILCDPPYHLTSIVKRFSRKDAVPTKNEDVYRRASAGFMGQEWDGGDIAFQPETWKVISKHLHPGGFMMAFAGTRGYHRMACAIEDAGFIIHPAIGWLFGTGFPKATRLDRRLDAEAGEDPEIVGEQIAWGNNAVGGRAGQCANGYVAADGTRKSIPITEPTSPLARAFKDHRYGMQALKPAFEFIAVAQKPFKGRPIDCIARTGAGTLNIREGRIDARWPANLTCDEFGAAILDEQSGILAAGNHPAKRSGLGYGSTSRGTERDAAIPTEEGGASRFYLISDWLAESEEPPALYCAKASIEEREAGLEGGSVFANAGKRTLSGGLDTRGRPETRIKNPHPTVKPIKLCRWLAGLLLPPPEFAPRRIMVPFAGSGSECCSAHLAGWDDIIGIELSTDYSLIATARSKFWQGHSGLFSTPVIYDIGQEALAV